MWTSNEFNKYHLSLNHSLSIICNNELLPSVGMFILKMTGFIFVLSAE